MVGGRRFSADHPLTQALRSLYGATIGMRVSEAEEEAGLDIVEHGMYGYPEQFIHLEHLHGNGRERAEAPR